jgi:hypothetical protein
VRQGQNPRGTPTKEALISAALGHQLKQWRATRGLYHHIDLNAGSGHNGHEHPAETTDLVLIAETGWRCRGTPVTFWDKVEGQYRGMPLCAWFVDKDANKVRRLRQTCRPRLDRMREAEAHYVIADNEAFLRELDARVPLEAYGTLLCDPNGITEGFPVRAIGQFITRRPELSVIWHWNFEAARRVAGYNRSHAARPYRTWRLEDVLVALDRPHWLISTPFGTHRGHSILVGSSHPDHGWRFPGTGLGFYPLESSMGRELRRTQSGVPREATP